MNAYLAGGLAEVTLVEAERGDDELALETLSSLSEGDPPVNQLCDEPVKLTVEILRRVLRNAAVCAGLFQGESRAETLNLAHAGDRWALVGAGLSS